LFTLIAMAWQIMVSRRALTGQTFLLIRTELASPEMRNLRARVLNAPFELGLPEHSDVTMALRPTVSQWPEDLKFAVEHVGQSFDAYGLLIRERIIPRRLGIEFYGNSAYRCFQVCKALRDERIDAEDRAFLWQHFEWLALQVESQKYHHRLHGSSRPTARSRT